MESKVLENVMREMKLKLPEELQNKEILINSLSSLIQMVDKIFEERRIFLEKTIGAFYTISEVVSNLPRLKFDKLSRETLWAETAEDMQIKLNEKFQIFLDPSSEQSFYYKNLTVADQRVIMILFSVIIIHELAHAYLKFGWVERKTSLPYLENGHTPKKLLQKLGGKNQDFGDIIEFQIFGDRKSVV